MSPQSQSNWFPPQPRKDHRPQSLGKGLHRRWENLPEPLTMTEKDPRKVVSFSKPRLCNPSLTQE